MNARRQGRCPGVTFVEVLVVLVLLALAIIPLTTLFQGQARQASQAGHLLRGHSRLLELLGETESRLHATRFAGVDGTPVTTRRAVPWGEGTREVEESVAVTRSALTTGLVEVRATVAWDEWRGPKPLHRTAGLTRLIAAPAALPTTEVAP